MLILIYNLFNINEDKHHFYDFLLIQFGFNIQTTKQSILWNYGIDTCTHTNNALNNAYADMCTRVYTPKKHIISRKRERANWLGLRAGHKDVVWNVGHLCPSLPSSAYGPLLLPLPPSLPRSEISLPRAILPLLHPAKRHNVRCRPATVSMWKHTHVTLHGTLNVTRNVRGILH